MRRIIQFIGIALCLFVAVGSAHAGDVRNVFVGQHQAELLVLPKAMRRVLIADRSVAGVVKHAGRKVSVIGHNKGKTDIRFMDKNNRIITQVNLHVGPDLPSIKAKLKRLFPQEDVGVEMVNESVALTGVVSNPEVAAQVTRVVDDFVREGNLVDAMPDIINLMHLRSSQQVTLRVRVGELRKEALQKMGFSASGVISTAADILHPTSGNNVFKVHAEPTLTAISGETAEFLAGGEFPVPVAQQGGTMSVDYKTFGVKVNFTPYVLSKNRIRLAVGSEVSELSKLASVKTATLNVPSVTTRRSQTTVELGPGESFVIAGLIKDNHNSNIGQTPGLGDIPVLSALFRSAEFQRNETELVVAVTPYLVNPVEHANIHLPTENFHTPSQMETLFFGALGAYSNKPKIGQHHGLEGPVGYMLD